MRIFFTLILVFLVFITASPLKAQYYGEGGYYSEGGYYGQGGYYSEGGYYGEGGYLGGTEGGYYGQGTYGGGTGYSQSGYTANPGAFYQYLPQAVCNGSNPNIVLSWSASPGATGYKILYVDPDTDNTLVVDNNWISNITQFTATGLTPGHRHTFRIQAFNGSGGSTFSDGGNWSHVKFGTYTVFPNCSAPAAFSGSTTAACQAVSAPSMITNWAPASSAVTYYMVTPVTNNLSKDTYGPADGSLQPIQVNNPAPGITSYTHVIPGAIGPGEQWRYEVVAFNNSGSTPITGGTTSSTSPVQCELPTTPYNVTYTPTTGPPPTSAPAGTFPYPTTNSGNSITLTWNSPNATTCSGSNSLTTNQTSASLVQGPLLNPPDNDKLYTLTCTNGNLPASISARTVTQTIGINIQGVNPNAFIQTTGGDIHTNESILITP